jgi:hypothetical protein
MVLYVFSKIYTFLGDGTRLTLLAVQECLNCDVYCLVCDCGFECPLLEENLAGGHARRKPPHGDYVSVENDSDTSRRRGAAYSPYRSILSTSLLIRLVNREEAVDWLFSFWSTSARRVEVEM